MADQSTAIQEALALLASVKKVKVGTPPCPFCLQAGEVEVLDEEYQRWRDGQWIQEAMKSASVDVREQLISGTHPECWKKIFAEGEE